MKRNLLLILGLAVMSIISVNAAVTVEESTDAEYLINGGYSQAAAEDIFVSKNRALGKPIEPLYEKSQNILVKGWRKFYTYLDPAQDTYDRLHHDIKLQPAYSDL